jgi:hypothetical protein
MTPNLFIEYIIMHSSDYIYLHFIFEQMVLNL